MSAQRAADEDLVQLASTGRHRVLKPPEPTDTSEEIAATQREVRRILAIAGYASRCAARALDAHRSRRDAPGRGADPAGGAAVPDVPGRVQLGQVCRWTRSRTAWSRSARWCSASMARRPAAQPAGRRRDRRRRQRARVPAADPDPVPLHPAARGLRLPAARRVPARPPDGHASGSRGARSFRCCRALPARFPASWPRAPSPTRATGWRPS